MAVDMIGVYRLSGSAGGNWVHIWHGRTTFAHDDAHGLFPIRGHAASRISRRASSGLRRTRLTRGCRVGPSY
jgi:hypothetical protein